MSQHGYPNLKVVNESIRLLYRSLNPARVKGFKDDLPPERAFDGSWSDPALSTQRLARNIAIHFRLAVRSIVVTFSSGLPMPGRVELSNSSDFFSDFFIEIHTDHHSQPECVAAILAHEIAHIFLYQHPLPSGLERRSLWEVVDFA
jgi:hypothetical protein